MNKPVIVKNDFFRIFESFYLNRSSSVILRDESNVIVSVSHACMKAIIIFLSSQKFPFTFRKHRRHSIQLQPCNANNAE